MKCLPLYMICINLTRSRFLYQRDFWYRPLYGREFLACISHAAFLHARNVPWYSCRTTRRPTSPIPSIPFEGTKLSYGCQFKLNKKTTNFTWTSLWIAFLEQSLMSDHSVLSPPSPAELASNQVSLRSTVSNLSATPGKIVRGWTVWRTTPNL